MKDLMELVALSGVGGAALLLTPKELWMVADARFRYEEENAWWHTSSLICMIHNLVAKKSQQKAPSDFHPFHAPKRKRVTPLADFKAALVKE